MDNEATSITVQKEKKRIPKKKHKLIREYINHTNGLWVSVVIISKIMCIQYSIKETKVCTTKNHKIT